MKKKYKVQIFISVLIVNFAWGMIGGYTVIENPDQQLLYGTIAFAGFFISLLIPIRIISKKAQKDLPAIRNN